MNKNTNSGNKKNNQQNTTLTDRALGGTLWWNTGEFSAELPPLLGSGTFKRNPEEVRFTPKATVPLPGRGGAPPTVRGFGEMDSMEEESEDPKGGSPRWCWWDWLPFWSADDLAILLRRRLARFVSVRVRKAAGTKPSLPLDLNMKKKKRKKIKRRKTWYETKLNVSSDSEDTVLHISCRANSHLLFFLTSQSAHFPVPDSIPQECNTHTWLKNAIHVCA